VAWQAAEVHAQEPVQPAAQTKPWYKRMFGKSEPPPAPATQAAPVPKERPADAAARVLQQERDEYLKQLEALSAIKLQALQANDETTMERADALEREATEVYQQRIAHLPCARLKPLSEEALDRQLGTGVATNPLMAGSTPGKTASAKLGTKGGDR